MMFIQQFTAIMQFEISSFYSDGKTLTTYIASNMKVNSIYNAIAFIMLVGPSYIICLHKKQCEVFIYSDVVKGLSFSSYCKK